MKCYVTRASDRRRLHLDLPTIERLEHALGSYPGCVVLVTHDDAFARAVTRSTISL